jgi:hypothetical protein
LRREESLIGEEKREFTGGRGKWEAVVFGEDFGRLVGE